MLPFSISLRPGTPIHDQVVYAVRRAIVTGQLRPGDPFPSVRSLSVALKINPNTAHKIVATLIDDGQLVVRAGVGTFVGEFRTSGTATRRATLERDSERLVIEARRAGVSLKDLIATIRRYWSGTVGEDMRRSPDDERNRDVRSDTSLRTNRGR
jgi:GntR family transcriptional regulator